jgi:2'-5' RNA ligase
MPYTLATVPDAVKKLDKKDQRKWVAVWNSAYARAKKDGKSDKDAESAAFAQANGVVMGTESMPTMLEGVTTQDIADLCLDEIGWPDDQRADGVTDLAQRLAMQAIKPEYLAEPNADYLGKLRDLIKSKIKDGDLSDADLKAIIRAAAGYAGGVAKARNRVTAEAFTAAEGDSLWVGFWLPSDVANEIAIPGGELPGDLHLTLAYLGKSDELPGDATERLRIAVQAFALTVQPIELRLCGVSRFSAEHGSDGKDVIYAVVDCGGLQDFRWRLCMALYEAGLSPRSDHAFTPHVTLAYVEPGRAMTVALPDVTVPLDNLTVSSSRDEAGRETFALRGVPYRDMPLVMSERQYIEPPATIPILPVPGSYAHPAYGKIDMSPDRIASFVQNFQDHVYQDRLPIDLEHETLLGGAAGWITDLVTNTDGSVDAVVEWNERGADALRDDRFFYISPAWYDEWRDPINGETHENILMGAALTTRPFFKPAALRSLAASEDAPHSTEEASPMASPNPKPESTPVAMTEEQSRRMSELESENKRIAAELEASKATAEQSATQATQLAERVQTMERDARRKRFTEEVTGKAESGGPRWFGEPAAHVAHLEHLSSTVGEDHELFTGYVAQQRALAEQLRTSNLFGEAGTSSAETSADPQEQITALATKRAAEKGIGIGEAQRQIASEHPDLAKRAGEAARVKV